MQLDERCVGERMYSLGVGVRRRTPSVLLYEKEVRECVKQQLKQSPEVY